MKAKNSIIGLLILLMVSSTGIMLEISMSRLFSYIVSYHFVFIIIAFTLFGLGIGEILYYYSHWLKKRIKLFYSTLPFGILISYILLVFVNKISFFSSTGINLFINITLSVLPFINIGLVKADIFQENKNKVTWFYGIDVLGSAGGALLTVVILNNVGLPRAFLISYILFVFAGILFWISGFNFKGRYYIQVMVWIGLVLGIGWLSFGMYTFNPAIGKDNNKDLLRMMSNPAVKSRTIATEWNSFGKTDLVEFTTLDGATEKTMFIDGAAGTDMISIKELEQDSLVLFHRLMHFPAAFELNFSGESEKDSVLIIGPGGGIDIAAAYFANFKHIDAVEVNPSFVTLMQKYNPSTFVENSNIKIYIKEGRNFIRTTKSKYDAILLTIPVTKGGRGTDFYGLTENYLFTKEAVNDYLNSLTPEGKLIFTMHNRLEVYRMLSTYLSLMEKKGMDGKTAMQHILIYSNGMMQVLVIKMTPFERKTIVVKHLLAHQYNFDKGVFFIPYVQQLEGDTVLNNQDYQWYMFDQLIYGISQNEFNYNQISDAAILNLRPVSDDSPYFFNYENGIPKSLSSLFLVSLIILGWVVYKTAKGWTFRQKIQSVTRKKYNFLAYVVLVLGICYFFVQSYLFQVLNLQLSNPAQSFSLLLFTFLSGNGLGSFYTGLLRKNFLMKAGLYSIVVAIIMIAMWIIIIPVFTLNEIAQPLLIVLLLVPAFFIGIPFPLILKEVSKEQEYILPLFLGISSLVSMATAVMVIIISMLWGYSYILWLGIFGYIIVATSLILFHHNNLKK